MDIGSRELKPNTVLRYLAYVNQDLPQYVLDRLGHLRAEAALPPIQVHDLRHLAG